MPEKSGDAASIKERIRIGQTILGLHVPITLEGDRIQSILDRTPYDFLWVDAQHAPLNEERLVSFCAVAGDLGLPVQLRIKHTHQVYMIGNYLDLGPSGVEVPQVEDESTVDQAISSFYYPPTGMRSVGGVTRVGSSERSDRIEYARWWADYGVLWVQIESVKAVTKSRQLARPGVDCLSLGPQDLTFSLESHADPPLKTVDECIGHLVEQLKDTTVAVCHRTKALDSRQKYLDMGVRVLLERWDFYP